MNFDTHLFLCAVGLAFVLEGLPWALFPEAMRKAMLAMSASPATAVRRMGLISVCVGVAVVWLARYF